MTQKATNNPTSQAKIAHEISTPSKEAGFFDNIIIKGAREHNLKNIDLTIPRNKLIVFTGVSGSGKTSLAFDTLYAEGQRRYVESLSAYARQFLGQMEKPSVDYIGGLSPAISIEQKSTSKNPRSTVGTVTEIYDYLRVLYARAGEQYCHICGCKVGAQTVQDMVDRILTLPNGTKISILAPLVQQRKGEYKDLFDKARQKGFVRVRINGRIVDLSEQIELDKKRKHDIDLMVDRLIIKDGIKNRLTQSVETALEESEGKLLVSILDGEQMLFSEQYACPKCGIGFEELTPQHFSFNSPSGMCQACNGLGSVLQVDPKLVVPDESMSINNGAVAFWGSLAQKSGSWRAKAVKAIARQFDIDLDVPWRELSEQQKNLILYGTNQMVKYQWDFSNGKLEFERPLNGVIHEIERLFHQTTSEQMRSYYQGFMSNIPCSECNGTKLRQESRHVFIDGKSIVDLVSMSVREAMETLNNMRLRPRQSAIAGEVLREIKGRLGFLLNVGLHYLTLDRAAPTLSGGESQRIRLASQVGCGLVGVMYILDEPTIGLHQRDNSRLIETLTSLRDMGNTVIVVEHDPNTIGSADWIVDFGPGAGHRGGEIVISAPPEKVKAHKGSITGAYLSGRSEIPVPQRRRRPSDRWLELRGARHNNLKGINLRIPVGTLICVTGVSGSGKSSLINQTLYPAMQRLLYKTRTSVGDFDELCGRQYFDAVIEIDQAPIGRTPRSNPATYTKVFDHIRRLFSRLPDANARGYKPGRFSFNVRGGRCEKCHGAGVIRIEMQFLPDVYITCESCKGKRFNRETLEIEYKGKNISEILDMEVSEAYQHFKNIPPIRRSLETLKDVGLDYIKLGQPATTLSGGEAQRVKLAKELQKRSSGRTLYILDEPTTGLHFADVDKLLKVLNRLVDEGNTMIIIEHNLDVIKCADWIIDLGPEGGDEGGYIIAEGTPEKLTNEPRSHTGRYLKRVLG